MTRAYVGLGANLGDPATRIGQAFNALAGTERTTLVARSPVYRSAPLGPPDQPDYLNAVAALDTALEPAALLDALFAIERAAGRDRRAGTRWGPRVLDLDLLLFGARVASDPKLTLPHPQMHRRDFVLQPLLDLAPDIVIPGRGPAVALLAALDERHDLRRVAP
ncbi:MAG: 2-amino-4-hydroxy-6-hydroxymethyldihydropteridine diphosphokinase [Chromatiales bacterium]|nr:2-amino-4-hydroxy-6-hydroxymethyldihydropteridine diphosphokinase [Chromatiales bacterium]